MSSWSSSNYHETLSTMRVSSPTNITPDVDKPHIYQSQVTANQFTNGCLQNSSASATYSMLPEPMNEWCMTAPTTQNAQEHGRAARGAIKMSRVNDSSRPAQSQTRRFRCPYCVRSFSRQGDRIKHERKQHAVEYSFRCAHDDCTCVSFSSIEHFNTHRRGHKLARLTQRQLDQQEFGNEVSIARTKTQLSCGICNAYFRKDAGETPSAFMSRRDEHRRQHYQSDVEYLDKSVDDVWSRTIQFQTFIYRDKSIGKAWHDLLASEGKDPNLSYFSWDSAHRSVEEIKVLEDIEYSNSADQSSERQRSSEELAKRMYELCTCHSGKDNIMHKLLGEPMLRPHVPKYFDEPSLPIDLTWPHIPDDNWRDFYTAVKCGQLGPQEAVERAHKFLESQTYSRYRMVMPPGRTTHHADLRKIDERGNTTMLEQSRSSIEHGTRLTIGSNILSSGLPYGPRESYSIHSSLLDLQTSKQTPLPVIRGDAAAEPRESTRQEICMFEGSKHSHVALDPAPAMDELELIIYPDFPNDNHDYDNDWKVDDSYAYGPSA